MYNVRFYGHQNVEQIHNSLIASKSFENVAKLKVSGNKSNTSKLHSRINNSGNACYHSTQIHLSSCLLSKILKTKIYKIIILPVVLYGY
jgi:uncharacterized UBP type Zn finger protein